MSPTGWRYGDRRIHRRLRTTRGARRDRPDHRDRRHRRHLQRPEHAFAYDDGEVRQEFSICFQAQVLEGAVASSEESYEVAFFEPSDISDLEMVDSIRRRISHHLDGDGPAIRWSRIPDSRTC